VLGANAAPPALAAGFADVRMAEVRYRSRATHSRQPRQVRKEATVTGSCVCSGSPVPGLISERKPRRFEPVESGKFHDSSFHFATHLRKIIVSHFTIGEHIE